MGSIQLTEELASILAAIRILLFAFTIPIISISATFGQTPQQPRHPNVTEQLAAIPNLDRRLEYVQKTLDTAPDQNSLTATTVRYTLEIIKEARENPQAFDGRPINDGSHAKPAESSTPDGAQKPTAPPVSAALPRKHSDYIATFGITMDFGFELKRAEGLLGSVSSGRDPLSSAIGDVHLAYKSDLDGMLLPFRIYVPTNYDKSKKYPLIMFLHGANCDENTFMLGGMLQRAAQEHGYIVASINGRGPFSFYRKENGAEKDLFDVMAIMQKNYNLDAENIFLTGHSMGAMGTWRIGLEFRDRFAALAPMAGTRQSTELETQLSSGRRIPILITCGGRDTAIPPELGIRVYKKLKEFGYPAKIVEYPEDNHQEVYYSSIPEIFAWFEAHKRADILKAASPLPAGSGPYPATLEGDPGVPGHTVYRPGDLSSFGPKNAMPVVAWANGGCANSSQKSDYSSGFEHFLTEIASHGFLVVAIGPPGVTEITDLMKQTRSAQLLEALDWAAAESQREDSKYYKKVDPAKFAVMGMSCGGHQALEVSLDPRVTTSVIMNSGLPVETGGRPLEVDIGKEILGKLHAPIVYIIGGKKDSAYSAAADDFARINNVPVALANLEVGHPGTYTQPNGGEFGKIAVAWLKWQLKGDEQAGKMYSGPSCGLCDDTSWKLDKKRIP